MPVPKPMPRGLRFTWLALGLACIAACHTDQTSTQEENYVTVRLNDSLSRFNSVRVQVLAGEDTGQIVGTLWDGNLPDPGAIPSYRIEEGESRPLSIRVMGFDADGRLVMDMRIAKDGDRQAVTRVALPKPSPALAFLLLSAGTLAPEFSPGIKAYSATVDASQSALTLTLAPVYPPASMLVGAALAMADQATAPIPIQVGENRFTINVTAADTSTQYLLTLIRPAPPTGDTGAVKPEPDSGSSDFYRQNWGHRALVNVNLKQAGLQGADRLIGFPLLLRLNKVNFRMDEAMEGGRDLRFVSISGHALPYEISRWSPDLGEAEVWIRTDTLAAKGGSGSILMYWGNASAGALSNPAGVFASESDWTAVWHLEETGKGAANEYKDATGKFPATGGGGGKLFPARRDAAVGGGQNFNPVADQAVLELPAKFDPGPKAWTLQTWARKMGANPCVLLNKSEAQTANLRVRWSAFANEGKAFSIWGSGSEVTVSTGLPVGGYKCLGLVYDGAKIDIYMDGILRESAPWKQGTSTASKTWIGAVDEFGSDGFHGILDEFWVSSTARSKTHMRLSYENQKPNSTLVTLLPF
jgi:hypothetical protein